MPTCSGCGIEKSQEEFTRDNRRLTGYGGVCRECTNSTVRTRYERMTPEQRSAHIARATQSVRTRTTRQKAHADKRKTPCVVCGFTDVRALDYHHKDPLQKRFNISDRGVRRNIESLDAEIDKCVCLCKNHHALFHAGDAETVRLVSQEGGVDNSSV